MCPPPRSLALEANGCFMVQVLGPNRIQGCGAIPRARLRAPLGPRSKSNLSATVSSDTGVKGCQARGERLRVLLRREVACALDRSADDAG